MARGISVDPSDTIVAVASAPGGAPRGIVRIAGPRALDVVAGMLAGDPGILPAAQSRVVSTRLALGTGDLPPQPLVVDLFVWPGERSYARQPTVEIHTLGSPPLLDMLVRQACHGGARLAAAGEFTLRAFLAGRIDLTQAEAVLGVIDAAGESELQTALAQLAGGLAGPLHALREELLLLLADLEAGLDFADEDVEFISQEDLTRRVGKAAAAARKLVDQLGQRAIVGALPRVVLVGPTNVGKSSLFNALVARLQQDATAHRRAIVSPEPGATRDYLTARVVTHGIEWELVDTAGEETQQALSPESAAAQMMTHAAREHAALLLVCTDRVRPPTRPAATRDREILVLTKADQTPHVPARRDFPAVSTSATTGAGLAELIDRVVERLTDVESTNAAAMVPSTANRSEASLRAALESLESAGALAIGGESEELVAAEVRVALDQLGQVAGAVYTDDVLDRVFSRFCIGK